MTDEQHDEITRYQMSEALDAAITILSRWTDLESLTVPLKEMRDRLTGETSRLLGVQ